MKQKKKLCFWPAEPTVPNIQSMKIDNGEHLGSIRGATLRGQFLKLNVEVLPEEHDFPHQLNYFLHIDWQIGSDFIDTLTNLGALLRPGAYFDPYSLVGIPIMANIHSIKDESGCTKYVVQGIRPATEKEATRTDFDEDNLSGELNSQEESEEDSSDFDEDIENLQDNLEMVVADDTLDPDIEDGINWWD
ncbi:hypothetical protein BSK59_05545 [Paenibacillus odorifer]|uniref:hypothetical protein n=1 Tax=Paenibacillus odorifer TaxID=189426 RepID=UPI00096E46BA|nr:hypothetical protein [Paenibacillus odorifer]OME60882.1 hypothetical protein BSK59_05545 [Paenibacillus odorifer]